jgi:cellobiose phosphorylase
VPVADERGERRRAKRWRTRLTTLRESLESHGWDGGWYRRAWFGDGTPLGSATNDECRIDAIAQSWSVLSGVADPVRAAQAMAAADDQLVRRDDALALLFTPPFDDGPLEPGYIKGYVPGVRENGGQYTHAAVWAGMAFAQLGDAGKAWEVLNLINPADPANHGRIDTYKVEPYVMAADVYGTAPHAGRGGWTWYTGSAGWMYRLIVESLLGVQRVGTTLSLEPLLPAGWPGFILHYRLGEALYHFDIRQGSALSTSMIRDGQPLDSNVLTLDGERGEHWIQVDCRTPSPRPQALEYVQAVDESR